MRRRQGRDEMARCKVCHRQMSNPDHIAMGMGPVCAAKAAARAAVRDRMEQRTAGYPVERYQRIVRGCERLAELIGQARRYLAQERGGANETEARWQLELVTHWYTRSLRLERQARSLLATSRFVA